MFIAIEGSDGSGKSSLVAAVHDEILRKNPSATVVRHHKGRPPQETRRCLLHEYAIDFESVDFRTEIHLADRWHWGERTYAPIKRPHTNRDGYGLLGIAGWRWVELFMQSRGMAQFLLYQRLETLKSRVTVRGDDFINPSELEKIYNAYNETVPVAIVSETIMPGEASLDRLPEFAAHIVDLATAVQARVKAISVFPQYIGAARPSILIVGDQRNVTEEFGEETILPFMPVNGNSGEYLLSSLPASLWKNVGIVNGNEIEPGALAALHHALGSPPIAALGRAAEKALLKTTIHVDDYVVLPHPQAVRRFSHSKQQEYGEAIARVSRRESVNDWKL